MYIIICIYENKKAFYFIHFILIIIMKTSTKLIGSYCVPSTDFVAAVHSTHAL